jgi:serine/threonine protein kinase/tetratricopeptide (TPR) repeat protein
LDKKVIVREKLLEKRPPLYLYRAKIEGRAIYLSEIIPYITTPRDAIEGFLELTKDFSKIKSHDISSILAVKKRGVRILVAEEIIEGKTLQEITKINDGIDLIHVVPIFSALTRAIKKFHSKKIYGLGLEPENVLLKERGEITVKHPFFPIAEKFFKKTKEPEILKKEYLSPEHIQKNHADEKSDLFTLGIILYEAVNNAPPFPENSYEITPFRKKVPYCLKYITERLLDKNPSERFKTTDDFLEELKICEQELKTKEKKLKKTPSEVKETKKPEKEITKKEKPEKLWEEAKREQPVKKPEKRKVPIKKKKKKIPKKPLLIGISSLILLAIIIFSFLHLFHMGRSPDITSLSVNRNIVEAKDKNEEIVWRFRTGSDISFFEKWDIDGDGLNEVIIGTGFMLTGEDGERELGTDNGHLYIINEDKRIIFDKEIGRNSIYPDGASSWSVYKVCLHDIDNDNRLDYTALALSEDSLDCIVFSRTQKGVASEFWHSGKITCIQPISLKNEEELVCGGTNTRVGEKPAIFAISTGKCKAQSPPWGGEIKNQVECLLWYRFLPGGGTVSKITEKDSITLLVETERGQKNLFTNNGYQVAEDDTTDAMAEERAKNYFDCFMLFKYAMESNRENNKEQAIESLTGALSREIDDDIFRSVLHYQKGMLFFDMKKWRDASLSFKKATKLDPLFSHAFYKLGISYYQSETFKRAATSFRNAYDRSGKEKYFYRMADCYATMGEYRRARNSLLGIKKKVRNKEDFLMTYAKIEREAGNFDAASSNLKQLISINPKNLEAYILLADVFADMNKNIELADSLFNYACSVDSSLLTENVETLSWILYRKSHFSEAMDKINQAINREREDQQFLVDSKRKMPRLYYRKAIVSQTLGEKGAKEDAIQKATSSNFCKGYIRKQLTYLVGSPD